MAYSSITHTVTSLTNHSASSIVQAGTGANRLILIWRYAYDNEPESEGGDIPTGETIEVSTGSEVVSLTSIQSITGHTSGADPDWHVRMSLVKIENPPSGSLIATLSGGTDHKYVWWHVLNNVAYTSGSETGSAVLCSQESENDSAYTISFSFPTGSCVDQYGIVVGIAGGESAPGDKNTGQTTLVTGTGARISFDDCESGSAILYWSSGGAGIKIGIAVTIAAGGAAQQANIVLPIGPWGTTSRRIYRTHANDPDGSGSGWQYVDEIRDNQTETYIDNIGDISLGDLIPTVNASGTRPVFNRQFTKLMSEATTSGCITLTMDTAMIGLVRWSQTTPADGDWFKFSYFLEDGTNYVIEPVGLTTTTCGKLDWYVDDLLVYSGQDWYSAVSARNVIKPIPNITILGDGYHIIKGIVNGHNASTASPHYYWYLYGINVHKPNL